MLLTIIMLLLQKFPGKTLSAASPKIFQNLLSPLTLRKSSFEFWGKVLPGIKLASVTKINMTRNYQ